MKRRVKRWNVTVRQSEKKFCLKKSHFLLFPISSNFLGWFSTEFYQKFELFSPWIFYRYRSRFPCSSEYCHIFFLNLFVLCAFLLSSHDRNLSPKTTEKWRNHWGKWWMPNLECWLEAPQSCCLDDKANRWSIRADFFPLVTAPTLLNSTISWAIIIFLSDSSNLLLF